MELYLTIVFEWQFNCLTAELDALGDELLLDDDSSYLDEASAAPSIPEGIPSDSKTNKVQYPQNSYYILSLSLLKRNLLFFRILE